MKKLFVFVTLIVVTTLSSCKFDDGDLWDSVNGLKDRIAKLEELCKQMNTNISSLQTIVNTLQNNDYVTGVTPVVQNGREVGYTITFSKGKPITIYHGKDGVDGEDGTTPSIGVKQDTDGVYYWTLNGEWLTDKQGNKIKSEGADGANGVTPKFKIENDYWFISYDNGTTWTQLGKATGEDEAGGDSMFTDVDYKTSTDYVIFTLVNGTQIKLPTWSAFEALQRLCNETNTNLSALQAIVTALQNNDYITGVDPLTENGKVVGYTIKFAKSNPIVIYNGKDGVNGNSPVVGVKKDTDGIYYWTLDGEFIVVDGAKIKAQGTDGSNGSDGVTPIFKIENGYWHISYDNGTNWTQLGKATGDNGQDGNSVIKSVTQDESNVYITLADDTIITIPKSSQPTPKIIEFKDPYVKTICVTAWDTDGDSELSCAEAVAVATLGSRFKGNSLIRSFDELKYFTHLTSIEESAFEKCSSLTSIIIPAGVEIISKLAFADCSSLHFVGFENASILKTIGGGWENSAPSYYGAFYNCTALESMELPASVETIEIAAFKDCTSLKNLTFADGSRLKIIDGAHGGINKYAGAFANCSSMTTVIIPANVEIIGIAAFMNCTALKSVKFQQGSKLKEIKGGHFNTTCYGAFAQCENLTAFDASSCTQLEKIGDGAFFNLTNLEVFKIGTPTPPIKADHVFGYNNYSIPADAILKVPVGRIEAYKGWGFTNIVELE